MVSLHEFDVMSGVNLKDLDLKLLVVFEAIYATGNISRAAEKLAMSQPAVSNLLARLRELIDDPLFVRGGQRGVQPTVKAQAMVGPVREALGLIGRQFGPSDAIDLATYRRTFRLSILEAFEPILMPPVLDIIDKHAPNIVVESILPHTEFVKDVLSGTLDLVGFIYPVTSPEISVVPLGPADIVVLARHGHPRIGATLSLETYGSLGHVALAIEVRGTTMIDRELLLHGIKRRVVYTVPRTISLLHAVASTDLVCAVPRQLAEYAAHNLGVVVHEMPVKLAEQHAYLMWHSKMDQDPGHTWLRESILDVARQRLGSPIAAAENVTPFVRRPAAKGGGAPRPA
jgi:DNA-binding transcriptional LysR family regulator